MHVLWCEVSLVSQHVGTGRYHLAWGPEVGLREAENDKG